MRGDDSGGGVEQRFVDAVTEQRRQIRRQPGAAIVWQARDVNTGLGISHSGLRIGLNHQGAQNRRFGGVKRHRIGQDDEAECKKISEQAANY